ncbi:hypothetical protein K469DRAFT_688215 [Zopfia rhizophila CBS 207.26]|uniref:Uncharacterized protein n=1 Tax=Zopfia rhizophila CBS 207.26 TaxID=1314779 RepID=A0A6A6E327_9PEZI|nr:hypothetical protein K469DRAFT_688215 [Zopfia rhizophila CBS 207.26]
MPCGAEEFTETDDSVVIKYGEIYCRIMGHSRVLCSVGTWGALVTHVMEQYSLKVTLSNNKGRPSNIYLRRVKGIIIVKLLLRPAPPKSQYYIIYRIFSSRTLSMTLVISRSLLF